MYEFFILTDCSRNSSDILYKYPWTLPAAGLREPSAPLAAASIYIYNSRTSDFE